MSCYSDDIAPPIHRVCPTASEGGSPTLSAGGTSALPPPARAPLSAGLGARCTARSHAFSPPARAPLSAGQGARYAARCRARRPLAQGARCDARARRLLELAGAVLRIGDAAPAPLLQARAAAGAAPRAASVFCGGGGSGLGLEAAGFDVVLGIDNSAKALLCFKRNHPRARALNVSVASVLRCAAALRAANVVLADCSAPCQGWSTAGHQRAGDKRNQLTVRAAEVFALVRVPIVLFENVPRSQRSPEWKLACDKLRAAGYSIDTALVDASRLGVPQRRVRMFAVATQPGFGFDLAGPAKVVANSARTCVADVMPGRRHFYHLGRGKRDPCVFSSTVPSPTLRTNCDYHPGLRHRRRARDSAHIRETSPFSLADLRLLQGWPASSFLPERRRDAARILGNSVAPPVAAWLGSLARNAITAASSGVAAASARVAAAIRTPADLRFFQGAARLGWGKRALERFHTIQAAQRGWGHGAVQRMIEAKDASVPGAHTGPLPGTADPHVLRVHSRVPDTDAAFGAMHVQQMKRRERRRLSLLLRQHIASDGTLRDLMDPIWAGPPAGAPPSSANPPAHWGAKPWRLCDTLGDTASLPTHRSAVSACSRNFQAMHMAHCARCAAHSTAVHGHAPPIAALRSAFRTGCIPCSSAWTLDPGCYQREMIEEIRVGLSPPLDPAPPAVAVPNGGSCWNEWDQTIAYIEKTDAIGAFDAGVWRLPKGAVCSAMHMVTRASDRRALARDGTPCPVRSVTDLTASGVNNGLPRWPFRMPSVDDAVHLIGRFPEGKCYLGATDLSKFFPSLGLGPSMQRYCWIRDPRADTTWRGDGPPSASWLRWQAKRRRTGKRYPPYRRCSGVPLGIRVAPPFACGVSGEIVCFLTSIGLHASMYVDDMFCAAATAAQCKRDMDTAGAVFRWLGLRCNDEKQQGPARALDYLGLVVDTVAQTVTISTDRRLDLLSDVGRILSASTFGSKDLESVIGKLGFAAQVIRGGKAYLQRLRLALNAALKSSSSSVAIDAEARADASWWHAKLSDPVQGSRIFLTDAPVPVVTLKSDASGVAGRGWGYVLDGVLHWSRWHTDSVDANHMQYKEMIAIIHCMEEYGPHFANRIMRVGVDNSGVAYATNKMSSKCPLLMRLLRRLADLQCAHNSDTIAVHVSRQYNTLADLASRFAQLDDRQRACIQASSRRVLHARVYPRTAAAYDRRVCQFFDYCDAMGYAREFRYKPITDFYTFYVAGITGNVKLRAWTSLAKFSSAFSDFALLHGMHWPCARTHKRIRKHIQGIKQKYPHDVVGDHPLVSIELFRVAGSLGLRRASDLDSCDLGTLVFWARTITAHAALLRACEHSRGMQRRDFVIRRGPHGRKLAFLTVGRRRCERKLKYRTRIVPLSLVRCVMSAGYVLGVVARRVHDGGSDRAPLFPDCTARFSVSDKCVPWERDRKRLEALCRGLGVVGAISGRSLRAGGATDLFAVGATNQFVKHQGGWLGYSFVRYDRPTPATRVFLATKYSRRLRSLLSAYTQ